MNLPVEVVEAVQQGRSILFVGSRFASEAAELAGRDYPEGPKLAAALGWKKPRQMMGTRPKHVTPSVEAGAALLEANEGRAAMRARLQGATDVTGVAPTSAHQTALRRFPVVFTTCWDDLLEQAGAAMGGTPQVVERTEPVPPPKADKRVIVRLRGGFTRPETLRVTAADFAAAPLPDDSKKVIRTLIRSQVVFFVGYRPDDEEFERLWAELTECFGGELPRCHLAVAQGAIDDFLWQKWVWRGLLMFTADPVECMAELESQLVD
jgi:SIR2-like domain